MKFLKAKAGKLLSGERFSSFALAALIIAVVMVINALLYTAVDLFGLAFSYKQKLDYSLTGSHEEMFSDAIEAGKKVKISFCMAESDVAVHSTGSEVYTTARKFAEKYPDFIELDFINIITRQDKDGNLINLSKYKTDDTPIYKTSVIFECGDNHRVVTDTYTGAGFASFFTLDSSMYVTSYNGEEVIASMVSWVTAEEHKTAYFTQRHGEQTEFSFTNLLTCAGYNIEVIDLREKSVPEDADLLIISNPTSDFEASMDGSVYTETDRLRAYLDRGGSLYVALDPYVRTLSVLEGLLAEYGIAFSTSESAGGKKIRNIIKDPRNAITTDGFTLVAEYAESGLAKNISARVSKYGSGSVIVRDVCALSLSDGALPLLVSSGSSVLEAGGKTVSDNGSYTIAACSEKTTAEGKTSKIFVIPTVYLAVSDSLIANGYSNKDFIYSLFEDFFGAENMPYGCKPVLYSSQILENLTMGKARLYTFMALVAPVAVFAFGTVVLVRRKYR